MKKDTGTGDLFLGEQLKVEGCTLVSEHNEEYIDRFKRAASTFLTKYGEVSSEEITLLIGMPKGHPNAVGAAMRSFASEHHLKAVGYRKSRRPSCHAAIIAIWRAQ